MAEITSGQDTAKIIHALGKKALKSPYLRLKSDRKITKYSNWIFSTTYILCETADSFLNIINYSLKSMGHYRAERDYV